MQPLYNLLQRVFLSFAVALLGLAVLAAPSGVALADDEGGPPAVPCSTYDFTCAPNTPNDTKEACLGRNCGFGGCRCTWLPSCYCR